MFAIYGALFCRIEAKPSLIGLVPNEPESGDFVETARGYMIAYSQVIPGSNVSFEMVPVPAGTFLLGSPATESDRREDEGPQVLISVPAMWVGKYEVTWSEYQLYMQLCNVFERFEDQGMRQVVAENQIDAITAPSKLYEPGFTFAAGEGPRQPAVSMSQYAARQYTKWLSLLTDTFYRLPTEAEWEYACRAGTASAYSFGEDLSAIDDYAWHYENSDDQTHPVGEKRPNAWGLYDMHGNASEWVLDSYDAGRYATLAAQASPVSSADALYRRKKLFPRVLRGGSWYLDPVDCRTAHRRKSHDDNWRSYDPNTPKSPWWFASDESQDVGFRLVRPAESLTRKEREKFWNTNVKSVLRTANHRIDNEGRGERGIVDSELPAAIEALPTN
ncbi:MAG: formylglycine-generating enzyme family protein [Planctomycetota bacterium]